MLHVSTLELDHCKEIVLVPGSLFEFTSRFIPAARHDQLLALYALTRSVRSIPGAAVDDAVKWAKLEWWGQELSADPASPARHPVLRALKASGAREHLENGLLLELVRHAMVQVDAAPDADGETFFKRLAAQGETEVLLELALEGDEIEAQALTWLAAASSLFAMITCFIADRRPENLSLPLDLQAKHQLKSAELEQQPPSAEVAEVTSHLADKGTEWFAQGTSGLDASLACIHLQLRWAMEARVLARVSKRAGAFLRSGNRFGPSDAWFAWRFCRGRGRL